MTTLLQGSRNVNGGVSIPPKGYKEIHLREDDFKVITDFANDNDLKYGAAVKRAFKKAYGLKFSDDKPIIFRKKGV